MLFQNRLCSGLSDSLYRKVTRLPGLAPHELDHLVLETLRTDDQPVWDPDQFGIFGLHSSPLIAIIDDNTDARNLKRLAEIR